MRVEDVKFQAYAGREFWPKPGDSGTETVDGRFKLALRAVSESVYIFETVKSGALKVKSQNTWFLTFNAPLLTLYMNQRTAVSKYPQLSSK